MSGVVKSFLIVGFFTVIILGSIGIFFAERTETKDNKDVRARDIYTIESEFSKSIFWELRTAYNTCVIGVHVTKANGQTVSPSHTLECRK